MLLLAISYFGFYLHKFLVRDEAENIEFNNEQNHKDEKEMDSAVGNDKDTKECMNHQNCASNEQSEEGEKEIASAIETNCDIEAVIEDTKKCLTNENLALATTNIYVNSDVAKQINMFNVYNYASTSGRIFDYNYKIGNLTLETKYTQLDENNYYNVNIFASKIKVEQESSKKYYKEEDVDSDCANVYSENDDDSDCANNIYSGEDDDSDCANNIYRREDDDSESANNIYRRENDDSESANNIYRRENDDSESANNIYRRENDDSDCANNIYRREDDDSVSEYIYKEEDDDSESANNIYRRENDDSESANNIYRREDDDSESAYNIYNKEDIELNGAHSTICENIGTEDDDESGQIVGSMFVTDYSLNAVIVIYETNKHKRNYYCCVCDYFSEDRDNINFHMKSSNHLDALKLSPPLENNEWIRYIHDQYHCAVCDGLFKGPLLNHFIGASHILCATFARNKALNLRQLETLNVNTIKGKSETKNGNIKSDRQNGNVPKSITDLNRDDDCDNLVEYVKKESSTSRETNNNLSSPIPILANSALENNCHIQKSIFPECYNIPESSSYRENSNSLRSEASLEVYQENCNLPSQATLEFYNFLQLLEAYKRKNHNLLNSYNSKKFIFPDQATIDFFNFFKHMQAYYERKTIQFR